MPELHAETAYLFRHALLRDAAYGLQLPGDRAPLHRLTLEIIEELIGGRPAEVGRDDKTWMREDAGPADAYAEELAGHIAGVLEAGADPGLAGLERYYLVRAVFHALGRSRNVDVIRICERLLGRDGVPGGIRVRTLRVLGTAQIQAGNVALALGNLQAAAAEAETNGHTGELGSCLGALGSALLRTGDPAGAKALHIRSIAVHRAAGKGDSQAGMMASLCEILREQGRLDEALALATEAVEVAHTGGHIDAEAFSESARGVILQNMGRFDEARAAASRALGVCGAGGKRRIAGFCYGNMATICHIQGRYDEAEPAYNSALTLHRETGNREYEGIVTGNLATLAYERGMLAKAEAMYRASIELSQERGARASAAISIGNLGDLYCAMERPAEALPLLQQALAEHTKLGLVRLIGTTGCTLARCLLALGRTGEAAATWREGAAVMARHHLPERVAKESEAMTQACAKACVPPFDTVTPNP